MRIKKKHNKNLYLPLSDIEKIDDEFLSEMEHVKGRLKNVADPDIIKAFQEVLLNAYTAAVEMQSLEREVDYDIRLAEIEAKRDVLKPWRRCWLWRLLFQPLTNRAQDIIEARAELDGDVLHTAAEKQILDDRKKLQEDKGEKLSKRKLKKLMQDKLNEVIKEADKADLNEAFDEPSAAPSAEAPSLPPLQENAAAPMDDGEPAAVQEQEQQQQQLRISILPKTPRRRPRPPRSCR